MRVRRAIGLVAAFLAMSGSMLGSDPEKRLQVGWSELNKVIGGRKVTLQLAEGARVKGRVKKVTEASIVLWAKGSAFNAKQREIAREAVARIEAVDLHVTPAQRSKRAALTVGAGLGGFGGGSLLLLFGGAPSYAAVIGGGIAIGAAVAVLMNLPLRPKEITLIEILPDSPSEREPKSTNKDLSSTPTTSGEALAASLIEESRAERLRRQARRAVMRHDVPLDLSSLTVHAHRSGID